MAKSFYVYTDIICRTSDRQLLYTILFSRKEARCSIWAFEYDDEANVFAIQHNNWVGFSNPDGRGALQLPVGGEFSLWNPAVNVTIPLMPVGAHNYVYNVGVVQAPFEGYWSIDASNGYAVVSDLNSLIYCLTEAKFIYPHATWINGGTVELARNIAVRQYVRRFYTRYDGQNEMIALPEDSKTLIYQDPHFYEREQRYQPGSVMQVLREHGLF